MIKFLYPLIYHRVFLDKKKIVKVLLQAGIYGVVLLFVFLTVKDKIVEIRDYQLPNLAVLFLGSFIFSLTVAVNSLAWHFLMKSSGEKIPLMESINVYVSTYIVRYIPGNVWAVIARAVMNKQFGVKMIKTAWGWLIENVSFLMVGLFFSLLVFTHLSSFRPELLLIVVIALPVCAIFLMRYELLGKVFDFVVKKKFEKYIGKESGVLDLSVKNKLLVVGLYSISWIFYSLHYYFLVNSIVGVDFSNVLILGGINALSWSVGYLSIITPSGGGVREGTMILALTTLGLVGEVDAVVIALLARLVFVVGELIYFGVIKLIYYFYKRNESKT